MLADLEAPRPPPQHWPWKKLLLGLLGFLVVILAILFGYDEALEPYDDLLPARTTTPDARTNGYVYLNEHWKHLSELSTLDEATASQMVDGRMGWDSDFIVKLQNGRDLVAPDLRAALALPEFLTHSRSEDEAEVRSASAGGSIFSTRLFRRDWIFRATTPLSLASMDKAHGGDIAGALALIGDLHECGQRLIKGSGSLGALEMGVGQYGSTMALSCDLLELGTLDETQAAALAGIWKSDPDILEGWSAALRSEAAYRREVIQGTKNGTLASPVWAKPKFPWLLLKTNRTMNRSHRQIRTLIRDGFRPFPSVEAAKAAGWGAAGDYAMKPVRSLDPNYVGNRLFASDRSGETLESLTSAALFRPRALRVRIALYRWRLAHPGPWPATLDALVPEFLPSVPLDPWNGKPLLWDPAAEVIYAVGSDWTPDLPGKNAYRSRSWFTDEYYPPGLRLQLPPLPAKPSTVAMGMSILYRPRDGHDHVVIMLSGCGRWLTDWKF
jgi:hypothetical protein